MTDHELRCVVQDLIGVLNEQSRQIESLVVHVEQVTGRLRDQQQFSVVTSELSELRHRMTSLLPAKERKE